MARPDQTGAARYFTLFDTAHGLCGLAWSDRGVTRLQLPEASPEATELRLSRWSADATRADADHPAISHAVAAVQRYFAGERIDFADIVIDFADIGGFHREAYGALRRVGWGKTTTYGALAAALGQPGAARAVGQAMGRNPVPVIVPCHRVLASGGKSGGFSAFGGRLTKARLLELEGVSLVPPAPLLALLEREPSP